MLVLTRRTGEAIIIGDGIKLTVINIGPGRVKIGIEAPSTVRIDREEIHERIRQETASDAACDVLEGVSSDTAGQSDQATMIVSGPDTGVLKSGESTKSTASNAAATKPRLSEFRAHRKPR